MKVGTSRARGFASLMLVVIALGAPVSSAAGAQRPEPAQDYDGDGHANFVFSGYDTLGNALVMLGPLAGQDRPALRPTGADWFAGIPVFASGDFNHDGSDDLAVGFPLGVSAGSGTSRRGGGVWIFGGGSAGLGSQSLAYPQLSQDSPGVPGLAEDGDACGGALAAGDFNEDGYDDLAIGCPGESIGTTAGAGLVLVVPGGPQGLDPTKSRSITQSSAGMYSGPETHDAFGAALAAADFTGDGKDDLAIGVPGEGGHRPYNQAWGVLHLIPGSSAGLDTARSTYSWSQDIGSVASSPYWPQRLGAALAAGDVDGDGVDDLIAGAPATQAGSSVSGAVLVYRALSRGLTGKPVMFTQATAGVPGASENGDGFGASVVAGDLTGDGAAEVVVGADGEDVGQVSDSGAFTVLLGSRSGTTASGSFGVTEGTSYVPGVVEAGAQFSRYLTLCDVDGDGLLDIVAGMPYQDPRADSLTGGMVDLLINDGMGRPSSDSAYISGTSWDNGGPATVQDLGNGVG